MPTCERIDKKEHAMMLAYIASLRSEDPHRKVGAVALDARGYTLGLAYNGLTPGAEVKPGFWDDRDARRRYCIHAEQNLCALFKRGQVHTVAVTTHPCASCASLLASHGVGVVLYGESYGADGGDQILEFHSIKSEFVSLDKVKQTLHLNLTDEPDKAGS